MFIIGTFIIVRIGWLINDHWPYKFIGRPHLTASLYISNPPLEFNSSQSSQAKVNPAGPKEEEVFLQYSLLQVKQAGPKEGLVLQSTLLQSPPPCCKTTGRASWWWVPFRVIAYKIKTNKDCQHLYWVTVGIDNGIGSKAKIMKNLIWNWPSRLVILGVDLRHQLSKTTTTLTTLVEDLLPSTHLSQSRQRIEIYIESMHLYSWAGSPHLTSCSQFSGLSRGTRLFLNCHPSVHFRWCHTVTQANPIDLLSDLLIGAWRPKSPHFGLKCSSLALLGSQITQMSSQQAW